jgi:hypothetical protein
VVSLGLEIKLKRVTVKRRIRKKKIAYKKNILSG